MKYVTFAAIAAAMACTAPAAAEDYSGPYVQAGVGVAKGSSEIEFSDWFRDEVGDTQVNGTIAAGYARSFGRFNIGANVAYVLDDQNAGRTVQDYTRNPDEKGDVISVRIKDMWSLNLEPGVQIGAGGLLYGKISYAQANGVWTFERPFFNDATTGKMKLKGYGLGTGYKHNLGSRVYGFAEVQKTWFQQEDVPVTVVTHGATATYLDRYDTTSATAIVGLGIRF